ncbi:hypothetical protein [Type-E symbiont of Plautia stali]|uniref:hypothetical protein n=1 Tax=Type-E symbiont of Plautia stali TaxID=1560357 RepID=UPI002570D836|nr:hypothetical protein [Type-E symbiont of Plautia stali]
MIAILIKMNVQIKSETVMLLMPIVVAAGLYYLAWFMTKYLEPALRNMLKGKRTPAAEAG